MGRNAGYKSAKTMEAEANYFALALLMPKELLIQEFNKLKIDYTSDAEIALLAKKFQVTTTMLVIRLTHLNLF